MMAVDCSNPTGEFLAVAISDVFNVHPYPKTGNVRDATAAFTFDGPYEEVSNVLSALGNTMGSTMQMVPSSPMMVKSLAPPPRVQFTITNEDMSFWPEFSDVEDAE